MQFANYFQDSIENLPKIKEMGVTKFILEI